MNEVLYIMGAFIAGVGIMAVFGIVWLCMFNERDDDFDE